MHECVCVYLHARVWGSEEEKEEEKIVLSYLARSNIPLILICLFVTLLFIHPTKTFTQIQEIK